MASPHLPGDRPPARSTPLAAEPKRTLETGGIWLRVGISGGLLALLFGLVDLDALLRVTAAADPLLLVMMFVLMVAERLFAAFRWMVLLRVPEPRVTFGPVLRVTLVSNFVGSFLPGGVGIEILRVYGLSRMMRDLSLALSSVLVERLCGLLALLLLITIGMLVAPIGLPAVIEGLVAAGALGLAIAGAGLLLPGPRGRLRRLLQRAPMRRLQAKFAGLDARLDTYGRRPDALMVSLGLASAFQLLRVLTVAVGAAALRIEAAPELFVLLVPVGILVALLPISLGGLGPREATYVGLMGLAGIAPEPALVLALTREAMNLATTIPGAIIYALGPAPGQASSAVGPASAATSVGPAAE